MLGEQPACRFDRELPGPSMPRFRKWIVRLLACGAAGAAALALAGCGASNPPAAAATQPTSTQTTPLPGTGKSPVTIGDKNYTEQFILGELYLEALQAQGFSVQLNKNIGPTEVTLQELQTGRLDVYPEYLGVWNSSVAGDQKAYATATEAYDAGQRYALAHGLQLLEPTPFSDTSAIGVTVSYGAQNGLRSIGDLRKVAQTLTLGAPPQFQQATGGLPALEQAYGLQPAAFKALEIGQQYQALDHDVVQAAAVTTTDGELTTGDYTLLKDPLKVFGLGNVVPVVSARVADAEGPVFVATINRVSALLTLPVIRELNAAVDVAGQDPAAVAKRFLADHGVIPPPSS
jgi:osmoprotectant transport system substrate-binding protein